MAQEMMKNTLGASSIFHSAAEFCADVHQQYITPEHLLLQMLTHHAIAQAISAVGGDHERLAEELFDWLHHQERVPEGKEYSPRLSLQAQQMIQFATQQAYASGRDTVDIPHYIYAILHLGDDSWAHFYLMKEINGRANEFFAYVVDYYRKESEDTLELPEADDTYDEEFISDADKEEEPKRSGQWHALVTCVNDEVEHHNPLIGREAELERTIQVLCRRDKNNPLHVGEPGVGKTALVYGLADRINRGLVPKRLQGCRIYAMDMGTMLAGTQFRGDFEKRIKEVMEGAEKEGHAIIYIDEIHNLIGAGRNGEGSMDASNMLKPYLESGDIRFIGSTTYDEYKRYFAKSRGIVRRFQEIDIQEPSIDDAIKIVEGLQEAYGRFHHVAYRPEAIDYAVRASAKYITDRFLPDKAIDLIDEAGAYRELHTVEGDEQYVDRQLVSKVLAKTCKIDAEALTNDDNAALKTLRDRVAAQIFGQDEAVGQVVEAIEMAKAGLQDDNKPLASLLFVGPTGVGKTEVARVLAKELGVALVRFDMSEYTEKHTVAKLIGSPAGYVGYEDGGLLTDAIRKTPNCVLLLDEIEKAHSDIYNILLQVMDYAVLTDNKGQKADFRNVVVIMTSNAGAQYASMAGVGFNSHVSRGEAMLAEVKKLFKPEFLNRLSATVVFHDMDKDMARRILEKKIGELQTKLTKKDVTMELSDEAMELLLQRGFTAEYGAREMDRVLAHDLKPLLMRAILFGSLANGGHAKIIVQDDRLEIG